LFTPDIAGKAKVIEFPITGIEESISVAANILKEVGPRLVISIERCGGAANGKYLNMVCRDITDYTARIDCLFRDVGNTIGIGDGGNEIGMGNLAEEVKRCRTLTPEPAITRVNKLIIASVSNWGAYGLIAALSIKVKQNLLPGIEWEKR